MAERNGYDQGVFNWVDLCTGDTGQAKAFYGPLFGVTFTEPAEDNPYTVALKGERLVWGLMPQPEHLAGMPYFWETYIKVDDIEAAAARVGVCGGTSLGPVMDVDDTGRLAVVADPTGAVVILWEPGDHHGAQVVDEHGTMCWHELVTSDVDAAMGFYSELLGWTAVPFDEEGTVGISVGDDFIGSATPGGGDVPPHWAVLFAVDDCDAVVESCDRLGGQTVVPAMDLPPGRMAMLADDQGAMFWVITPNPDFSV